jgi:ABC-type polysaccharide/polyol phosphate transport system ATPase subunit
VEDVVIRFEHVSKRFRRFDGKSFLLRTLLGFGRRQRPPELTVLDDVSFEIRRNEALAILGKNGSGKSTLLRLIAGTCLPDGGRVAARGRIAPLLSLGVGLHPDMTGRECVWLTGAILGLDRAEIRNRWEAIIEFAELAAFVDTPLRFYSSGMQARLGFAIAVHSDPEIMLIDEVLAVGDQAFRDKCIARLKALRAANTTIVVVTHAMDHARELCTRAIWLGNGAIRAEGSTESVIEAYLAGSGS